jgi:hypothetical protein
MNRSKKIWRYMVVKEVFILGLAVSSLVFLAVEEFADLSADQLSALYAYNVFVGCVFIAEFFTELRIASNKKSYWEHNWYYLLAAIPLPYAFAEALRGLRLLRVVKLLRFAAHTSYEHRLKKCWYSH